MSPAAAGVRSALNLEIPRSRFAADLETVPPTEAGHESEPDIGEHRRPRARIETLADLIFGLSLGIDSIALIPSSSVTPFDMNLRILGFAFAFLFVITAWLIYTTYASVLPLEESAVTFLNVGLLLLVALIPYLLNSVIIGVNTIGDYSSSLFALDLTGILVILASFAHILGREDNHLIPHDAMPLFRSGRDRMLVLAVLMVVSVAPPLWDLRFEGVPLRLYMWTLPLISYWAGRAMRPSSRTYRPG